MGKILGILGLPTRPAEAPGPIDATGANQAAGPRTSGPPSPQNSAAQQVHDDILHFDLDVKKFQGESEAIARKLDAALERLRQQEALAMKGKIGTHLFVKAHEDFDNEAGPLRARRAAMRDAAQVMEARGEALAVRLADVGKAELEATFRTAIPRDVLVIARRGVPQTPRAPATPGAPGAASIEFMAFTAVALASAYFIAQDIRYVLSADNALDGLGRAAAVGGKYVVGAAEMALFTAITKSTPVSMLLGVVVGMCSDQGNACDEQEKQAQQKAQDKQVRENQHQLHLAIGAFLNEQAPGSVQWTENHWEIKNQKLWDETAKRVERMQIDRYIEQQMGAKVKAHELGVRDGRFSDEFVHQDDMHDWDVVKEAPSREVRFMELFEEYKLGFKEGNARRAAVMAKVRELGYKDGKTGRKTHRDEMIAWPEVAQFIKDGIPPPLFVPQLYENYDEGYESASTAARAAH